MPYLLLASFSHSEGLCTLHPQLMFSFVAAIEQETTVLGGHTGPSVFI